MEPRRTLTRTWIAPAIGSCFFFPHNGVNNERRDGGSLSLWIGDGFVDPCSAISNFGGLMIAFTQTSSFVSFVRQFNKISVCTGLLSLLSVLPLSLQAQAQAQAYDGPVFAKGLWQFERSLEVSSRNAGMANSKHVRVEPPVTRCVDPTESMKETFRPVSVGTCQSSAPEKGKNTYRFAKRCDYLGPVTTTISIDSATSYRETNEMLAGPPKKETVVARRVGDCGIVADRGAAPTSLGGTAPTALDRSDPSSYYPPLPR